MDIGNIVKDYFDKREIFHKASQDLEEVKKNLKPNISLILKMYYLKEREIYKKYNLIRYNYQYYIADNYYDDFEILKEMENYILIDCWHHYEDEDYSSTIKLPKNLNEIDSYVEQFVNEIESKLIMNKLANK